MTATARTHRFVVKIITILMVTAFPIAAPAAQPGSETHVNEAIAKLYAEYAVSEAVRAGDYLYIGGIVAFGDDGSVIAPNDGKKQAEVIYSRIKQLLAANGADAKNVVSETIYLTDWPRYFNGAPVRQKFYDDAGAAYPSMVGVEVVSLAEQGLVMEVQLVAHLGGEKK